MTMVLPLTETPRAQGRAPSSFVDYLTCSERRRREPCAAPVTMMDHARQKRRATPLTVMPDRESTSWRSCRLLGVNDGRILRRGMAERRACVRRMPVPGEVRDG